jgi:ketosteroid isomerase-like protein
VTDGELAWSYFERCGEGRIAEALELLDDDGTFWDVLTRDEVPMAKHKVAVEKAMQIVPMQFELHSMLEAEGKVVLEVESRASLPDHEAYNNLYCFIITVRDGKITHVREYNDTHHVLKLPREARALFAQRTR